MNTEQRWQAVNALFDELVELGHAEREARLDVYEGDASVAQEVRGLLSALDRDAVQLEPSPGASHLTLMGQSASLPVSLTGRRLGPWAVVREVGRGGMGAVYEAFRADDQYQKRVAVKTLTRGTHGEIEARRFQQERQILASLDHPSIATLIDGGVTDDGLPYLVMEFVDGEPIDQYSNTHHVSLRARLDLFRNVCSAVQYAHRNLVVHRDLKPSNILVSTDGNVKLVDFGIAKLLGERPAGDITLTAAGSRAFTTGYASPEQVRGEAISTSTDVYSLGVTLYWLLTGRLPIDVTGLTPAEAIQRITEASPSSMAKACSNDAATLMGFDNAAALAGALEGELDDIVMVALRKEPERRYATVAALSDDIKRYLQGQQVSARPDTWRYRVRTFSRRNPRIMVAMGMAAFSLMAGAAGSAWQAIRAGRERDNARAEAIRSARVVSFIEQVLAAPVSGALTDATILALDGAVQRARGDLAGDPLARAAVFRTAAKAYAYHNHNELAVPLIDSALLLDRRQAGNRSVEVGRDLTVAARIAYNAGLLDSAVAYAREAVELLRAFPSDRPDDLPTALLSYSFASTYAGHPQDGRTIAQQGIAIESSRAPSALLAYLHMALGEAALFGGDDAEAEAEYLRATLIYDSLKGPQPVERGIAELGLASLQSDRGAISEADARARRALEIFTSHWGPNHAFAGRAHARLALVAYRRGDAAATATEIAAAKQALEHSRLGIIDWVAIELDLARVLLLSGRRDEATERLRMVLQSRREELTRAPHLMAFAEVLLGHALMSTNQVREAKVAFDSAFVHQTIGYGPEHSITRATAAQVVFLSAALGESAADARAAALLPKDSVAAIRARGRAWKR